MSLISEIKKAFYNLKLDTKPELLCEPGRALVAESGSSIVRVVLRKKQKFRNFRYHNFHSQNF